MKKLLVLLMCLYYLSSHAQSYYGYDSVQIGGRNAIIKIPVGGGKYPVVIEWSQTNENADVGDMRLLYNSGIPKLVKAGGNPYFTRGDGNPGEFIDVKIQRGGYSDAVFADDMSFIMNPLMTLIGASVDSTKNLDGTYKHIGMVVEERGADLVFNSLTQNTASNNCFYHADPGWVFNHIKKLYVARVNDVCQYGSYTASAAYNHATTKQIWYYRIAGAGTIEVDLKTQLSTYSVGVSQKLNEFSGYTTTQLSDTLFSNKGLYSFNNVFRDLMDDTTNHPPPNYQAKVYAIFPLSIYASHDPQQPPNFFDGHGVIDPKNGVTTDTTSINNPQHKWDTSGGAPLKPEGLYFLAGNIFGTIWPGHRDIRLIFDLGGTADLRDTTKKFVLTDVYALNGEEAGHKAYLYNADKLFRPTDMADRIKMLAREDSLMVPFDSLTTTGTNAWIAHGVNDSMRYVMLRITNTSSHSSQFNEITFYGHYQGFDTTGRAATLAPETYLGDLPSRKAAEFSFDKRMGTNLFQGLGPESMKHHGDFRLYTGKYYSDDKINRAVDSLLLWQSTDVNIPWCQAIVAAGHSIQFTNQGSNAYTANQGSQIDIDSSGLDPEYPWNYMKASRFAFYFSRKYGFDTRSTTHNPWRSQGIYTNNGLGIFKTYEAGNEVEGHGGSTMAMFMKLSMEYDGHCGLYGIPGEMGVHNGDSTMLLSIPGMIDPDTTMIGTFKFLTALTRPDNVVPFHIWGVHKYYDTDTSKGIYRSLEDQVGIQGEVPEHIGGHNMGFLKYWDKVARGFYRWMPLSKFINHTEQGYGNSNHIIANTTEAASIYDIYPLIAFGGKTVHQSKATILDRIEIQEMFTAINKYNNYASSNQYGDTTNSIPLLFYAYGIAAGIDGSFEFTQHYAGWWHHAGWNKQLRGYVRDSVIQDGGYSGRYIVKLRSTVYHDSVVYIHWIPSHDGSTLASQTFNFGALASQAVRKWTPSDTDSLGTGASLTASGGILSLQTALEQPVAYFVKESASAIPPVANAGANQIVKLPTNSITLDGTGSTDADGTITGYAWSKLSGPAATITSPTSAITTVTGLTNGTYQFQLTVTDDSSLTNSATVMVYVSLSRVLILKIR